MKKKLAPAHFKPTDGRRCTRGTHDMPTSAAPASGRKIAKAVPGYDNFLSFMNAATDALLHADILQSG